MNILVNEVSDLTDLSATEKNHFDSQKMVNLKIPFKLNLWT